MSNFLSYKDALIADRALKGATDGLQQFRIVLGGNANADFMIPGLRVELAAQGFAAEITSSAYNNWVSDSFTETTPADAWIIWLSGMGATRGQTERGDFDVTAVADAAARLQARGTKVVVILPEPLVVENDPFSPFASWRADVIADLRGALPAATIVLSIDHLVRALGMDAWTATRYWEQAKVPCHPDAATAVGTEVAAVLARSLKPAVRAVVVDLDDTMWGGLIGEVGPEGLELDPDGKGRSYLELQRFLADLSAQGIAIGVVSKNEDAIARRGFTERPEMILSLDSFVAFDASWEPKYQAIQRFATQLNIGIDAVCFLDDSKFERDEASRMLPGLIVPELPEAVDKRVEYLIASRLFLAPSVSEEDKLRVSFFKRAAEPAPQDLDAYLASLDMSLEVSRVSNENMDRVVSLLHKTNQFNVTLWRPTAAEVTAFAADANNYAYAFRLVDRLGDAGIIAVVLASGSVDKSANLAAWVMSCRVFSRGVEWATAEHLASWLADQNIADIAASYHATSRNALVGDVLGDLGFGKLPDAQQTDESGEVTLLSATVIKAPIHHVKVCER